VNQHDYLVLGVAAVLMITNLMGASFSIRRIYLRRRNGARSLGGTWRLPTSESSRQRKLEESFRVLAQLNAKSDVDTFNELLKIRGAHSDVSEKEHHLATLEAYNNIKQILNVIATTFSLITGDECSASISVIEPMEDNNKEDYIIVVLARDERSDHSNFAARHHVNDNSIFQDIFKNNVNLIAIDDLKAAESGGMFKSMGTKWPILYNAVLVAAIPPLGGASEGSVPRATLSVENRVGGLDNAFCRQLARELARRLAVKLDRLDELVKVRPPDAKVA
jgi:hypothetical protein